VVPPAAGLEPNSDQPSHAAPAQTTTPRIASACILKLPSHATAATQKIAPSVAGITTNDTMKGSRRR
jgi:hypothetical protein